MPKKLADWARGHFEGPGGRPSLFYVVYGTFGEQPALSSSKYRSTGVPAGFDLFDYNKKENPDVVSGFREGYLWEKLQAQNPKLARQIARSPECLILRGEVDDCETLNYLRDSVGVLTFLLDHGGVTVYDPFMFQWWEPEEWQERIFAPNGPVPRHHVVVLTSDEPTPSLTWFHSRGMRKFGRPDLSLHNVPQRYFETVIDLFERFIELQAFGGVIDEGTEIRMKSLPSGMTCFHRGDLDDPDFNNVHVEIVASEEW